MEGEGGTPYFFSVIQNLKYSNRFLFVVLVQCVTFTDDIAQLFVKSKLEKCYFLY